MYKGQFVAFADHDFNPYDYENCFHDLLNPANFCSVKKVEFYPVSNLNNFNREKQCFMICIRVKDFERSCVSATDHLWSTLHFQNCFRISEQSLIASSDQLVFKALSDFTLCPLMIIFASSCGTDHQLLTNTILICQILPNSLHLLIIRAPTPIRILQIPSILIYNKPKMLRHRCWKIMVANCYKSFDMHTTLNKCIRSWWIHIGMHIKYQKTFK